MRLAGLALLLAAFPSAADEPLEAILGKADALYAVRDQPGKQEEIRTLLDEAAKAAPDDYAVLWRRAQLLFWISDDLELPKDEKSRIGKECWDVAEKAAAARPAAVEGWFVASGCIGNYSLGMGILKALTKGLEGKFKDRLSRAEAIDPAYSNGGVPLSWGRFYYELPWPKYDAEKSEIHLRKALRQNAKNVRALVYLAELYLKEDHPREARTMLERAVAHEPGAYDAPEERRWQARARVLLSSTK